MSEISGAVRRTEARALPAALRRLVARAPKGLLRFLAVGVGGLSVDIAVLWLAERAGIGHVVARLISLSVATLATWALNRHFTFGESGRRAGSEFGRYAVVALVAQSVNFAVFVALCAIWPAIIHSFAAFVGAVIATGFSYTGQRFFTFAPQPPVSRDGVRD